MRVLVTPLFKRTTRTYGSHCNDNQNQWFNGECDRKRKTCIR